jgi:hypothetical protein
VYGVHLSPLQGGPHLGEGDLPVHRPSDAPLVEDRVQGERLDVVEDVDGDRAARETGEGLDAGVLRHQDVHHVRRGPYPFGEDAYVERALLVGLQEGHVVRSGDHVDLSVGQGGQRLDALLDGLDGDVQPRLLEQSAVAGEIDRRRVRQGQGGHGDPRAAPARRRGAPFVAAAGEEQCQGGQDDRRLSDSRPQST